MKANPARSSGFTPPALSESSRLARRVGLVAALLCAMAQSVQAAALTWDTTIAGNGTITAGSGTWANGAGNWNNASTSVGINWSNATPDAATFFGSDGTHAITVGGPISAASLTFGASGYTLSAASPQTITLSGAMAVFAGESATIGANVTVAYAGTALLGGGAGILTLLGSGAALANSSTTQNTTIQSGLTVNVGPGGTLSSASSFVVGGNAAGANLNITGGAMQVTAGNLILGNGANFTGAVTLASGSITLSNGAGLRFGANAANSGPAGNATFHLDGGTLTTTGLVQKLTGVLGTNATFNFNGGTLRAGSSALGMAGLDNAFVKAGGARIDTNGFNPAIAQPLLHDPALGGMPDGGLTKLGAGTLTLNGTVAHTFNGGVHAVGGTLTVNLNNLATPTNLLGADNTLSFSGGTLSLIGKSGVNSSQSFAGTSVGAGNSTVAITSNGTGFATTAALGTVSRSQPGGVVSIQTNTGAQTAAALGIATVANPAGNYIAPWAFVGDSKTANARWAYVNASGQVVSTSGSAAGGAMSGVTSASTVYTVAAATNAVTSDLTAFGIQNTATSSYDLGVNTLTTEGLLAINPATTATITATTGGVRVGSGNDLVVAGPGNVTISATIRDQDAGHSAVTYAGGGTLTLSGANTHSGVTSANSGTLAIAHDLALQASALSTSGAGLVTLSVATPTLGGLTGSRNLSSVITSGYSGLSALTLNPGAGLTHIYSGAIADGAAGMTLTKNGAGTQVLSGVHTYTGATTVSAGTLELDGSLASSVTVASGATLQFTLNDGLSAIATTSGALTLGGGSTVTVVGTPAPDTTYTLLAAASISGTATLSSPVAGFVLVTEGNALKLAPSGGETDTTAPVITLNGSANVSVAWGATYADADATASDDVDGSVAVVTGNPVNTAAPGVYTVTYDATDAAGNVATRVTRTVTVFIADAATVGADGYTPLLRYAFGATSPSGTVQAPVLSSAAGVLSITAVVRTNDSALAVVGQTTTDLANVAWSGTGVTVIDAPDQSGLPAGCARKIFSVSLTGASRKFLRLNATH